MTKKKTVWVRMDDIIEHRRRSSNELPTSLEDLLERFRGEDLTTTTTTTTTRDVSRSRRLMDKSPTKTTTTTTTTTSGAKMQRRRQKQSTPTQKEQNPKEMNQKEQQPEKLTPHGQSQASGRRSTEQREQREQPVTSTTQLNRSQVKRLKSVLDEKVDIHGRGNFPTISTRLIDLIICVRRKLCEVNTPPTSVKLNGGAASFVASLNDFAYADVDLIFPMDANDSDSFDKVREAVFSTIVDLMPESVSKERITADTLKDVYVRKMVKVSGEEDRWSLFSLNNDFGRCIELKFVDCMRRQFEFSVDSFQICLDPLLDAPDATAADVQIQIESVFGDVHQAMNHLHERLIDTRKPEEIRGGGLLKYCHLIIRGYKAARPGKCRHLEKYMCSRFFIDFPDVMTQEHKLRTYLGNHFGSGSDQWSSSGEDTDSEASTSQATSSSLLAAGQAKYDFLMLLHRVINESTVCLMSHERRQVLSMIDRLAFQVSLSIYHSQSSVAGHTPRSTLLYLPPNATSWIPVI